MAEKHYFEFLSAEYIKTLDGMLINKFAACYFLLAMSNISSRPLIYMPEKKIWMELKKIEEAQAIKPVAMLS